MSGSDRGKRIAAFASDPVVAVGFCAVAIFGTLLLIFSLGSLAGQQKERADTSYRYQESASEAAKRECVGTDAARVSECVVEKIEGAQNAAHDSKDLTAQQEAAWAAMLSSLWGLGAFVATVLGLIWIKGTLDATRRGAEAARGGVSETKRIGEAQARAYMSISCANAVLDNGDVSFDISYANSGQSPARSVHFNVIVYLVNQPPFSQHSGMRPMGDIAAHASGVVQWKLNLNVMMQSLLAMNMGAIIVTAQYVDIF